MDNGAFEPKKLKREKVKESTVIVSKGLAKECKEWMYKKVMWLLLNMFNSSELDKLTENNPTLFSEVPEDDIRLLQHLIDDNIMRGHPDEKKFSIYKYADVFDDAATEKVVCIKYISTITYKDV